MGQVEGGGSLAPRRLAEHQKYHQTYKAEHYGMSTERLLCAKQDLAGLFGSLLDVGCGRGELLRLAEDMGMEARGVEVVPALIDGERVVYGEAHALPFPDKSFDHVTCMDVMEHLLPEDSERVVREFVRVARKTVILAISNVHSVFNGMELHINRKPYPVWDEFLRQWIDGEWEWKRGRNTISDTWILRLR
jgi:ubiquinone/menaquinone biosynthesis C-methylase UbiE